MRDANEEKLQVGEDGGIEEGFRDEVELRDADFWIDYGGEG